MPRSIVLPGNFVHAMNLGSVEIPPFAVVEIVNDSAVVGASVNSWSGSAVVVRRPTDDNLATVAVNSESPISVGRFGLVSVSGACWARTGVTDFYEPWTPGSLFSTTKDSFDMQIGSAPGLVSLGPCFRFADGSIVMVDFARSAVMKQFCHFTLTSDHNCSGTTYANINDQFGPGVDHSTTSIELYDPDCIFSVTPTGAKGIAVWRSGIIWDIIQMECPA